VYRLSYTAVITGIHYGAGFGLGAVGTGWYCDATELGNPFRGVFVSGTEGGENGACVSFLGVGVSEV
jgi:hypothetical protein